MEQVCAPKMKYDPKFDDPELQAAYIAAISFYDPKFEPDGLTLWQQRSFADQLHHSAWLRAHRGDGQRYVPHRKHRWNE